MQTNRRSTPLVGSRLWWAAVALVLAFAPPARAQEKNPHVQWGLKFLNNLEYKRALEAFEEAARWQGNTPGELARIYLYTGVAQCELLRRKACRESFRRALGQDPRVSPPANTSPKIRKIFEQVRAERGEQRTRAEPAKPTPVVIVKTPKREPAPAAPVRRTNWPAWLTLGLAVAAGGAGLATGIMSRSEDNKATDISLPYDQAIEHGDRASALALSANILFVVAGVTAITSGALFWVGHQQQERAAATVVPTRGGVIVGVSGAAW